MILGYGYMYCQKFIQDMFVLEKNEYEVDSDFG